jgi:5-carboxymethyl-2-hydroxymuconate isomerase
MAGSTGSRQLERLRRIDALVSEGHPLAQACASEGLREGTYKRWRSKSKTRAERALGGSPKHEQPEAEALAPSAAPATASAPVEQPASGSEAKTGPEDTPSETNASVPERAAPIPLTVATPPPTGRSGRRRLIALAACLVAGPAVAVAAAYTLASSVRTETTDSLARQDATLAALKQSGAASKEAIEGLRQVSRRGAADLSGVQAKLDTVSKAQASANAELARETRALASQFERQQRDDASNRDDLTRLRAQLAEALQTQSALDAEFSRQRAAVASQLDALRQGAGRDREALSQVGQRLADVTQAQGPLRTDFERQRTALGAEIRRLQQEAAGSRAEVARLRTEMAAIVQAQFPLVALQQEMLANRAGLRHLEGEFDAIRRASSRGKPL